MSGSIALSVVVPCYNEEKNIPLIFARFSEALHRYKDPKTVEIILVNNGSHDRTSECITSEIANSGLTNFRMVTVPVNQGYGFGIVSGLKEASGETLAWTHADMQTDPYDVMRAFELYQREVASNM